MPRKFPDSVPAAFAVTVMSPSTVSSSAPPLTFAARPASSVIVPVCEVVAWIFAPPRMLMSSAVKSANSSTPFSTPVSSM